MARQPLHAKYRGRGMSFMDSGIDVDPILSSLVGRCAAASAHLEVNLALLLGSMLGVENAAAVAVFTSLKNARTRQEALSAAARNTLQGLELRVFHAILSQYKQSDSIRNDIVHGVWGRVDGVNDAVL